MTAIDVSATSTIELVQGATHQYKEVIVETPATTVTADWVNVDLSKYACTKVKNIFGNIHSTANSIIITEAPTTSVTNGVLKIVTGGSAATGIRVFRVIIA